MIVVCDTGPLVAAVARRDRHHALCARLLEEHRRKGAVVVPVTVAVEIDYLLRSRGGTDAARRLVADVDSGAFLLEPVGQEVFSRARELDEAYADADLGLVDASVIAVAEHLGSEAILTLDHAHFRLVRDLRCSLLPPEHEVT